MAIKLYKQKKFKWVRGMDVQAHLDTGWTYEPVQTKTTLRPRRTRKSKQVSAVETKTKDLTGPADLTTIEEQ
jgi:hypothetical protein